MYSIVNKRNSKYYYFVKKKKKKKKKNHGLAIFGSILFKPSFIFFKRIDGLLKSLLVNEILASFGRAHLQIIYCVTFPMRLLFSSSGKQLR